MYKVKSEYSEFKVSAILCGSLVYKKLGELTQEEIVAYIQDTPEGGKFFDKTQDKTTEKNTDKKGE